LTCLTGFIRFR